MVFLSLGFSNMLYKRSLAYLAEDHNFDYDDFSKYCFANYSEYVWRVFDGIEYCREEDADFLAKEYKSYKEVVSRLIRFPLV